MAGKNPGFYFYPGDWLRDGISGCSLAAQGLWLRMLILAHDCTPRGVLEVNGSPMPDAMIARKCGCDVAEFGTLVAELDAAGVVSRARSGAWYSRRMVRDSEQRASVSKERSEAGKKGARSRWGSGKPMANAMANAIAKDGSSTSSSTSNKSPPTPPEGGTGILTNQGKTKARIRNSADLADIPLLIEVWKASAIPKSDHGLMLCIAAAEKASVEGKDKVGHFMWLIGQQYADLARFVEPFVESAGRKLAEFKAGSGSGKPPAAVQVLADKLGGGK
ncbi:MAG: hypothetical protein IT428_25240 [Planctomycetaceae bacterium]|nr:hypothetical protein [Planctomycetaceae bacterium]